MKLLDLTFDGRINGWCATVSSDYEWYLRATTGAEENLRIQRAIIKDSKAYRTLRADLARGCILPPIVLAVSDLQLSQALNSPGDLPPGLWDEIETLLATPRPATTYIIDGLQRTNALRQIREDVANNTENLNHFLRRPLRVEIWLNIRFGAIAYRMLLLNAGQKPMSIKHQVEVLSSKLAEELRSIEGIEIISTLEAQRRTKPRQFALSKLSQALQAWLQGSPNIDLRNTVMEQLLAESAIETLGTSLSGDEPHDDFKALVQWFAEMDGRVFAAYPQFFGNETVLLGIAAAVGAAQRNDQVRDRMQQCLELLKTRATEDPASLGVVRFEELRAGVDVRKVNVGQFSRDLVYRTFQEFFLSGGVKSMEDCWAFGAAQG